MDQTNLLNEFAEPEMVLAGTGQRLANYIIDMIVIYALIFGVGIVVGLTSPASLGEENIGFFYLLTFLVVFGYYPILEATTGKTLGKMVTKTTVVNQDGTKISFGTALLRTLCRMVPFEFISAFTGNGYMWHDSWAKTMLIRNAG